MNTEIVPSVGIVVLRGNEVLVVRHEEGASHLTGSIGLPGGRVGQGETRTQAAVRELREETGLETSESSMTQLPTTHHAAIPSKNGLRNFEWTVFVCKKYTGALKDSEETCPFWVKSGEIQKLNTLPNVRDAIKEALAITN